MSAMLKSAMYYHQEGLCVIPVKARDKAPALDQWEEYQARQSTGQEIRRWFGNGSEFNIGCVHGAVSGNFVSIDIDHDTGLFDSMRQQFPALFAGRLEQSGSHEGYHIPLRLEELPDLGYDERRERPKGNKTWKTEAGHANIRARWCQTVQPPSVHPSGNRYRFLQKGPLVTAANLDALMGWLDELAPPLASTAAPTGRRSLRPPAGDTLLAAVQAAWPDALSVFAHFGLVRDTQREPNGEIRVLGNGGLLINPDSGVWYNFSDEFGGHVVEAWGWCRFGSAYDGKRNFRQVLLEMAQAAGIDTALYYQRGDERATAQPGGGWHWGARAWGRMRA